MDLRSFWPGRGIIEVVGHINILCIVAIARAHAIVYVRDIVVYVAVLHGMFFGFPIVAGRGRVVD